MTSTLILVCFFLIPRSLQSPDPVLSRSDGGSSTRDDLYSPWTSAETRTPRWAPETDPQWGPRHLDSHREKDHWKPVEPLQSDLQQLELNCWFVWPEENWPPDWAWFLPRFFSPFCHRWSFGSLPAVCLWLCLVGDTSFPVIFIDLIKQRL